MPVFHCNNCLDNAHEQPCVISCGAGAGEPNTCPRGNCDVKPVWREMKVSE